MNEYNINEYNINKIDKYLQGKLDAPTAEALEEAMKHDETLQQEVKQQQLILQAIKKVGDAALINDLSLVRIKLEKEGFFEQFKQSDTPLSNQTEKQLQNTKEKIAEEGFFEEFKEDKATTKKSFFNGRILVLMIGLLLLLLTFPYFFCNNQVDAYDEIYAKHFKVEEEQLNQSIAALKVSGFADRNKARKNSLRNALKDYKNCQDVGCENNHLSSHLELFPKDETALFYKALTNMKASNYEKAATILQQLANSETAKEKAVTHWYLGLAYLKIRGKETKGIALFTQIANDPTSAYTAKARQVLEEQEATVKLRK